MQLVDERAGYLPDAVMILAADLAAPSAADIAAAIALLDTSEPCTFGVERVSEVPAHSHPMRTLRVDDAGHAKQPFATGEPVRRRINRRQDLPEARRS